MSCQGAGGGERNSAPSGAGAGHERRIVMYGVVVVV